MLGQLSLERVNRYASLGILPLMLLAIAVFSRAANGETTAASPTEGTLVVANLRSETLTFIDLADDRRAELALPGPPHELLFEAGRLYVTLGRGDQLVEVDVQAKAILRTIKLAGEPHGIASLGGNLYVTLDKANAVVVIDRATLTELRRIPTGDTPHVIAATGSAILVTDSRENTIGQLEPFPATAPSGAQPEGIAVVGNRAVAANALDGTLTIFDLPGLGSPRSLAVGGSPVRVFAIDASQVVASVQGSDQVVLLDPMT